MLVWMTFIEVNVDVGTDDIGMVLAVGSQSLLGVDLGIGVGSVVVVYVYLLWSSLLHPKQVVH